MKSVRPPSLTLRAAGLLAVASILVHPACNDAVKLQEFLHGGPTFTVTNAFGQLIEVAPAPRAGHYFEVRLDPPATEIFTPSTGEIFYVDTLDGLEDCLILKPKLRDDDDATAFGELGPGLAKPDNLRIGLCNLDKSGGASPLEAAIETLYVERGVADPSDMTADFFETLIDPDERKLDVWAAPEAVFPDPPPDGEQKRWSRLGPADGGLLRVIAFSEQDGHKTYLNPAPYLAKIPLAPPASALRRPTFAEIKLETAGNEAFSASVRSFDVDLGTGAINPSESLGGFFRVLFRLTNDADDGGSTPVAAPYEISYELREIGGAGAIRSQARFFLNAIPTSSTVSLTDRTRTLGERLYRVPPVAAPVSDPATQTLWMQLPVDALPVAAGDTPSYNAADGEFEQHLMLGVMDGGARRYPPGGYELTLILASAFDAAVTDTKTVSFEIRGAAVDILEDTDADHAITAADTLLTAVRIARWDDAYGAGPGFAVHNNADAHADRNFVERDLRRFYIRVTDPEANADPVAVDQVTARIGTIDGGGGIDDDLTDAVLTETGVNTGVFVSRSQLLTTEDLRDGGGALLSPDDDFAAHDGSGGTVGDDLAGDRTHRSATIDGQLRVFYQPAGGAPSLTHEVPVCPRAPSDERRKVEVRAIIYNEPFDDVGFDHDGDPATPPFGAGNGTFDFTDGNASGSHDAGEASEPYRDFSSVAGGGTAPLLRGDDVGVAGGRGPVTTDAEIDAQIARARLAWSPACIIFEKIGATAVVPAPAPGGVDILLDGTIDFFADLAEIYAAHDPDITDTEVMAVFAGPMAGANAIAFPPANNPPAVPHGEDVFLVTRINLEIEFRTLAHELGHVLANQPDAANDQTIFFPAATTHRDDHENSYRRFTAATETDARTVRPGGALLDVGNTLLKNP